MKATFPLSLACLGAILATWAASPALSAPLAQYDFIDYGAEANRASVVEPTNAEASSYTLGAGTAFSDGTDTQYGDLGAYSPFASFTVTADSGFELDLDGFIFNYGTALTMTATESYTINVLVNGNNVYSDTVTGTGAPQGYSSGTIDLSGTAFQGLSSATIEITVTNPVAGGGDTASNEIRLFGDSNAFFDPGSGRSDMILTGDLVAISGPDPEDPSPPLQLVLRQGPSANELEFEWNNRFGKCYDLLSSTGLDTSPESWPPP